MKPKFKLGSRVYRLLYRRKSEAGTVTDVYMSSYGNKRYTYRVKWDDSSWGGYWWGENELAPLASQELADAVQV